VQSHIDTSRKNQAPLFCPRGQIAAEGGNRVNQRLWLAGSDWWIPPECLFADGCFTHMGDAGCGGIGLEATWHQEDIEDAMDTAAPHCVGGPQGECTRRTI